MTSGQMSLPASVRHRWRLAALVRLPDDIRIVPMRDVAWRMGLLVSDTRALDVTDDR